MLGQTFFRAIADQVTTVIANARAFEHERTRAETLAELDKSKTTFFSNVSHEFRTPLTLLLGPLETLLSAQGLADDAREQLIQMQRNAFRMLRLVNALLEFSRMDAGRHSARFAPTDLAHYKWEFQRHGKRFDLDVPGRLTLDQPQLMLDAARAGLGLGYFWRTLAAKDLASGKLIEVLTGWAPSYGNHQLYYPSRKYVPAGLRAFFELARETAPKPKISRSQAMGKPAP